MSSWLHMAGWAEPQENLCRTSRESRTHMVYLDRVTRLDAASDFFGEQHVPRRAITMGISTILKVRATSLNTCGGMACV